MRQIMNKKTSSPKQITDKRVDTGKCQRQCDRAVLSLMGMYCFICYHSGSMRSATKRPATSPAPVAHNQQPAHHSNVCILLDSHSI